MIDLEELEDELEHELDPGLAERGKELYRSRHVIWTEYDPKKGKFKAKVKDRSNIPYDVSIKFQPPHSEIMYHYDCNCYGGAGSEEEVCSHVAALLAGIVWTERTNLNLDYTPTTPTAPDTSRAAAAVGRQAYSQLAQPIPDGTLTPRTQGDQRLVRDIMELFGAGSGPKRGLSARTALDDRTELLIDYHLHVYEDPREFGALRLELKIGPKRTYVVPKLRDLMDNLRARRRHVFTKNFEYDPALHRFHPQDAAILEVLMKQAQTEEWLKQMRFGGYSYSRSNLDDRAMLLPPILCGQLLPLLQGRSSVRTVDGRHEHEGLTLLEGHPPATFALIESPDGSCQLSLDDLRSITPLPDYGLAVFEGRFYRMDPEDLHRLQQLKRKIYHRPQMQVTVPAEQMEPLLSQVLPQLKRSANIEIAPQLSERLEQAPLLAKVYLDRVKDRLIAGVEFHYGEQVLNPLEDRESARNTHAESRILVRDAEKERTILSLFEQAGFARTEGSYRMEDEDAEFDFLYEALPELEKHAEILATSAVRTRLHTATSTPRVKVDVDERTDWLEVKFDLEGIPEAEIKAVLQSLEEKRRYHRLKSGALVPLQTAAFEEIGGLIAELGIRKPELQKDKLRLPAYRALQLQEPDRHGKQGTIQLSRSLRKMLDNIRNPDNLDFPVPPTLEPVLRDYQKYGFQWLKTLSHYGFGGILADDMGLGKTIQAIALLVSELPAIREQKQPALIVCPASLTYNWQNEFHRFAPDIRTLLADGTKTERESALTNAEEANIDVIITSYPLLRRDVELYTGRTFHTLILDEAQAFKNHATQTAQAVKSIEAARRFALTGTPVENRLEELWSISDTVFPELFPSRRGFGSLPKETIARRIRPFLLRRLKTDVLKELPDKIETLQASELLEPQKKLYAAYLAQLQKDTLKHLVEEGLGKSRIRILAGLTRLRQICCHPALFVEGYEGGSAKLEQLLETLEECRAAGKRALIFSQFTGMLEIIRRELTGQDIPYFYLDGSTPPQERLELCNRFNGGERDAFLISLKAGGTGLNLTGADTVILYDLWWNPAVEQQAADRAYRMGQKNVVQVIRLVAQGTVEDKMYELQQRKLNLVDEVIGGGDEALSALTEQELMELLQLDAAMR